MSKLKYFDGTNWNEVNGNIVGDTLPIGAIIPYGSTTAPANWLVCDGSYVSKETYADLYDIIGDNYLDGGTAPTGTFRLPDFRTRVPVGYKSSDSDFNAIGKTGGEKTHTLTIQEIPVHNHAIGLEGGSDTGANISYTYNNSKRYYGGTDIIQNAGNGASHNNLQPYQTVNYIIKAKQSAGVVAQVETSASNSNTNVYSCKYVNDTLSNLIKIKEVTGTTDGNGFLNLNMNLNQYIVLGVRVKIGQDSFANPYNIRGIDGWSVQLKTWDGQNIGSTQFTLEVVYIET